MSQVSSKLRSMQGGLGHWCPGCEEIHLIPRSWTFDGNLESPTFTPSVRITGKQHINVNGVWTGEWVRDANGKPVDMCCHYILTAGVLMFCPDCTHALKSRSVPLPDLPPHLRDEAVL